MQCVKIMRFTVSSCIGKSNQSQPKSHDIFPMDLSIWRTCYNWPSRNKQWVSQLGCNEIYYCKTWNMCVLFGSFIIKTLVGLMSPYGNIHRWMEKKWVLILWFSVKLANSGNQVIANISSFTVLDVSKDNRCELLAGLHVHLSSYHLDLVLKVWWLSISQDRCVVF